MPTSKEVQGEEEWVPELDPERHECLVKDLLNGCVELDLGLLEWLDALDVLSH